MTEKEKQPVAPKKRSRRSKGKGRGGRRAGGGRPPFRPSIEQRQTVEEMKFCGDSDEVIARAIGIDADTLRKRFADELADGYAQRRKEVVAMLFREARGGNVSAMRRLEEIGRAANAGPESPAGADVPTPKAGKKEQQHAAAQAISGIFSPPPAPKLVVNNA